MLQRDITVRKFILPIESVIQIIVYIVSLAILGYKKWQPSQIYSVCLILLYSWRRTGLVNIPADGQKKYKNSLHEYNSFVILSLFIFYSIQQGEINIPIGLALLELFHHRFIFSRFTADTVGVCM